MAEKIDHIISDIDHIRSQIYRHTSSLVTVVQDADTRAEDIYKRIKIELDLLDKSLASIKTEKEQPMSNFKTGQLVLITTPDKSGIFKISVEWCRICYALIPEDFLDAHSQQMHYA